MSKKLPRGALDRLWADPANWLALGIYYCKDDPRIIVPKRIRGLGWTMNFAHGSTWGVLFILLISCIVPTLYLKTLDKIAIFLTVWIILLVITCVAMSSTGKHED